MIKAESSRGARAEVADRARRRSRASRAAGSTLLGALAALSLGSAPGQESDMLERGQAVFERRCAACHGRGFGDESEGAAALPGTRALRLKYQGAVPALLEQRTDLTAESIRTSLRYGVASMPPFRPTEVSDEDIEAIAAFLARDRE